MDVDTFRDEVAAWIAEARDPRWKRPLHRSRLCAADRASQISAQRTATAPTSSPAAARISCASIPSRSTAFRPSRWSATHVRAQLSIRARTASPILIKEPKLLLNDDKAGKPEGIHLVIGRRPHFAFGNSTGDRQMLEYTTAGGGARLAHAGAARRRRARIRLRARAGPARNEDRDISARSSTTRRPRTAGSSSA